MKHDLGMKFSKIKTLSLHSNSTINLVLRQQFAIHLIAAMSASRRIINIDETWLGMEDFRRMKWHQPGETNSVPRKLWSPRVSLILAFDSNGEHSLALSQSNTNSIVITLFIRGIVK